MNAAPVIDLTDLRRWVGRSDTATDTISRRLVEQFGAVFGPAAPEADQAPPGIHWCLAPAAVPTDALDADGHPSRGGFLPPVPLPRRMWAGSDTHFLDPLRMGDAVTRVSRISDVTVKQGKSGALCFVAVQHEFATSRGTAIRERQDLVFRAPADAVTSPSAEPSFASAAHSPTGPVPPFRYAALTFNSHRIHYDRDYARDIEGYAGLVVQGPLQATWLLRMAAAHRGRMPRHFTFRGLRPLTDIEPYHLRGEKTEDGVRLSVHSANGVTMEALAKW